MTHSYTTLGGKIVREVYGSNIIDYFYDNSGRPYKLVINENGSTSTGYFVLNLQGDVIAILDSSGAVAVEYEYDAWGKETGHTTSGSSGNSLYSYNALKYRGYYYDADLGLYYLNSRYYDPEVGRFISADTTDVLTVSPSALTDKNLYAYCDNNPVVRKDAGGEFWTIASGALVGAVISAGIEFGLQLATGGNINVGNIALAALSGAASGALAATSFGYIGQAIGNGFISGVSEAIAQVRGGNKDLGSVAVESLKTAGIGVASVIVGGRGIKAKGTAYRQSIDNLNSLKGNVYKAISNPKGYRHQINRAIKVHQIISRAEVKSTSVKFGLANLLSNLANKI